jgi:hypothetical protein
MVYNLTLNTKDKVSALAVLIEEINEAETLEISDKKSKISGLKSTCLNIDFFINQAIEFSKINYLSEERIILLIEHCKDLKQIQKSFEKELVNLGSNRNFQNEKEIRTAFDFELEPKTEINFLLNAIEIEKRIRTEIESCQTSMVKNQYENIFINDKAYELFLTLHNLYKERKKYLADYSFLYQAMQKDNLVVCRGVDFKRFLSKEFDITIEKIDSRQSGTNPKTTLYNSIKEKILTKK